MHITHVILKLNFVKLLVSSTIDKIIRNTIIMHVGHGIATLHLLGYSLVKVMQYIQCWGREWSGSRD